MFICETVRNLVVVDERQAQAVDARMEIDLRLGAAFTRFQVSCDPDMIASLFL